MRWLYRHHRTLAVTGVVIAAVVGAAAILLARLLPWGWVERLVIAMVGGWVVARVCYPLTNRLFGRVVGALVAIATFVALSIDAGPWWTALSIGVAVAVPVGLRWSQRRRPDEVPRDGALWSFLADEGQRLVDTLDVRWGSTRPLGRRNGLRAVHSHGSLVEGDFVPTPIDDSTLQIPFLGQGPCTVIGRFSNFGGTVERDDRARQTHGLALRLLPHDGAAFDIVLVDIRRFPVADPDDFRALFRYFGASLVRRLLGFSWIAATGRTSWRALYGTARPRPRSYLTEAYHGLNTFHWGAARVPVRLRCVPERRGPRPRRRAPERHMLDAELREHLAANEATYRLRLVDGRELSRDRWLDPMRAWPRCCPVVDIGTVTFRRYVPGDEPSTALLQFDPFRLPEQVLPSADPILHARRAAYPVSFLRRCAPGTP